MEAPVRHVRSRDGTRIAYTVEGSGPAVMWLGSMLLSNVQLFPGLPGAKPFLTSLSRRHTVVRVDLRGTGLSDRGCSDYSPNAMSDDVEAVVTGLGLKSTSFVTTCRHFMPALRFAARRPDLVDRLAFSAPAGAGPAPGRDPGAVQGLYRLAESNWHYHLQTAAQRLTGRAIEEVDELVAFMNRCVYQRDWLAQVAATSPDEDRELAPSVAAPVLVMYREASIDTAQSTLAFTERFPNARFVHLPGRSPTPAFGDPALLLEAIEGFLSPAENEGATPLHSGMELTPREIEVLRLLTVGMTGRAIGGSLSISPATVSRHVQNIYTKLGVHRRAEAVAWAVRHGFG